VHAQGRWAYRRRFRAGLPGPGSASYLRPLVVAEPREGSKGDGEWLLSRRAVLSGGGGLIAAVLAGCSSSSPTIAGPGKRSGSTSTAVDLRYANDNTLTGTALGHKVHVNVPLPKGMGHADGSYFGDPVSIDWNIAYNGSAGQTLFPVTLNGTVADLALSLSGQFQHLPNFLFQSGSVSGSAGASSVQAQLTSAEGETTSSINAQGTFDGTPFTLYATINGTLTSSYIEGTVGGKAFRLDAAVTSKVVRVTGHYSGPPALLGLMAGSLLYFLPGGIFS